MTVPDYEVFLKQVKKEYAPGTDRDAAIRDLSDEPLIIDAISTGSLQVDRLTGIGGFPRGRISELFGVSHSGKTTLAYGAIRSAQRQGIRCAYIDTEFGLNQAWLERMGIDTSRDLLFCAQPEIGEVALDLIEDLVRSECFGLIVLDSVAALIARKELAAGSVEDNFMGTRATMIGKSINRIKGALQKSSTAFVAVNHLKEKVGLVYGDPRYRPGGKALDYASSLMLEIKKGEKLEEGKEITGFTIKVLCYKNRFRATTKAQQPEVKVYADGGISLAYDIMRVGLDTGVLTKRGAWIAFQGENVANGEANTEARLAGDDELAGAIIAAIAEHDHEPPAGEV